MLVDSLLGMAAPNDTAVFSDVDEIARPSSVQLLARCLPAHTDLDAAMAPPFYILELTLFKYGVHCLDSQPFNKGTRAFSVATLRERYGNISSAPRSELARSISQFSATRMEAWNRYARVLTRAGWHLTSFGTASDLERKIST